MVKRKYEESDSDSNASDTTGETLTSDSDPDIVDSEHESDIDFIDDEPVSPTSTHSSSSDNILSEPATPPPRAAKRKAMTFIQRYLDIVEEAKEGILVRAERGAIQYLCTK
jgi:hypothetical protein